MKKILMIILAVMFAFCGCSDKTSDIRKGVTYDGYNGAKDAVMTINGEDVSADEFNYFIIMAAYDIAAKNNVVDSDRSGFWDKIDSETGKSYKQNVLDDALERCKPYHIYRTQCKSEKIELSDESKKAIKENSDKMKVNYSELMNELQLKAGGLTPAVYEDITEMSQYSIELYTDFTSGYGKIGEDEIEKYYNDNYVRAKHILVMTVDSETEEELSEEEKKSALRKITEVKERLDNGESFETLIEEYNEDPGYSEYPDGYTFAEDDSYSKEFKDTAFSLEEDAVSGIVESDYGYSVIKRYPLLDEYMSSEAIQEKIIKKAFGEKIDMLCADADVRLNKNVYDSLDPEKILSEYLNSQDEIMAEIQKEYERIYAENPEDTESK